MRIAFLGTPEVAVPALEALVAAEDIDVAAVLCNPDRPRGRRGAPQPPPVKVAAEAHGLQVWQPAKPREVLEDLRALDLDACAVVAYGALLPKDVLAVGGRGFVNLHFSLLPRWRGAAPVQHALKAGDQVTGITTFVLDPGMDTGPVLRRVEVAVQPGERTGSLLARLAELGAPVLVESLRALHAGEQPVPQPEEGATLAPKITPEDVAIDLARPAVEIDRLVRSADPAPGAHTTFRGSRLKVFDAPPLDRAATALAAAELEGDPAPGTVLRVDREGVVVACGEGAVRLTEVQPAGKPRMAAADFANGARIEVGERLGADSGSA
ncbi:MAG: methionyl-tRNA formyltransferase [Nitriliruptor sp.]|nr:MAG: methionyl-tRNA formyltransferase [Nitriliruptor sp.]